MTTVNKIYLSIQTQQTYAVPCISFYSNEKDAILVLMLIWLIIMYDVLTGNTYIFHQNSR